MTTSDEPIEAHPNHRRVIVRNAIIYTPTAAITTALFLVALFNLLQGQVGAIIGVVILGLVGMALDFEAVAALRDLRAKPMTTTGEVLRVWSKAKVLVFGRAYYLLVNKRVFEVNGVTGREVEAGRIVTVEHWPHTNTVISVTLVSRAEAPESASSSRR